MLKNQSRLESTVDGKTGYFYVDMDTPLQSVKEMMFQFQNYIGQIEAQVKAQQEKEAAEKAAKEAENPPLEVVV